jgi:hypothetical protein
MADPFDPYRDAQVVETNTLWPADVAHVPESQRAELDARLHADPQHAAHLEYVRLCTGFCRQITVTPADLERLK